MKKNTGVQAASRFDAVKWLVAILLIALAVVGNALFDTQPLPYRILGVIVVAGLGLAAGFSTSKGHALIELGRNAKKEIQRVVWPTRQETTQTTVIVIAAVFIVGLFLWLIDTLLGYGVFYIVNR